MYASVLDWVDNEVGGWGMLFIWVFMGVILLFVLVLSVDCFILGGNYQSVTGVVMDKVYTPSSSSVGVGVASTGKGVGPVMVSSSESEKWIAIVQVDNKIDSYQIDPQTYYRIEAGQTITMQCLRSKIFKMVGFCTTEAE